MHKIVLLLICIVTSFSSNEAFTSIGSYRVILRTSPDYGLQIYASIDSNDKCTFPRTLYDKYADYVRSIILKPEAAVWNPQVNIIVEELLQYDANCRKLATAEIIEHMSKRQETWSFDKCRNPILAIPESPGIGKSPIVIPITFNGRMGFKNEANTFATRILYSAVTSVRGSDDSPSQNSTWLNFYELFHHSCGVKLDAYEVVYCVKEVFGNRPVLFLIDEISKVVRSEDPTSRLQDDKDVLLFVGKILDYFQDVDCLVSSLSPMYVKNLLSDSQRVLRYVVLPTLTDSSVGVRLNRDWFDKDVMPVLTERKVDLSNPNVKYLTNMLKHVHLLLADYPRALQRTFVDRDNDILANLINTICTADLTSLNAMELLFAFENQDIVINLPSENLEKFAQFILQRDFIGVGDEPLLRSFIQFPHLYMAPNTETKYKPAIPGILLFGLISSSGTLGDYGRVLQQAFSRNAQKRFSLFFERCVLLSIAIRTERTSRRFGDAQLRIHPPTGHAEVIVTKSQNHWHDEIRRACSDTIENSESIMTIASYPKCPGCDGLTIFSDEEHHNKFVYHEVKTSIPPTTSIVDLHYNCIFNTLGVHVDAMNSLEKSSLLEINNSLHHVYIILYVWDSSMTSFSKEDMLEFARSKLSSVTEPNKPYETMLWKHKLAVKYIESYYDTNFRVAGKSVMKTLMPVSLYGFGDMAHEVEKLQ